MASVQYHTFTLITQMGLTIDINKDYSRVAWTSPNTSGTITPLVALNDSNLFKSMLKTCDAFKIHSVRCTAFVTPANTNALKHIVTFSDRTGIEDELIPDYVNSYGSAKHYILNSNAQSRVQWNGLTSSGIIESSTWGQADADGEGVIPEGGFNPYLCLQYQDVATSGS